jgi:hypothetical protein
MILRLACLLAFALAPPAAALPSFPGAQGFGAVAQGGRGGPVLHVSNLAEAGPGSLRAALEFDGPRIVVFDIGGEIVLSREIVAPGRLTLAGQTAPGDGITISGARIQIAGDDVIIRGLRIRPGDGPGQDKDSRDALSIGAEGRVVKRVIIDHCSLTWATDENAAIWGGVEDVTWSRNLIAEGLDEAGHSQVRHSMGLLVGAGATRVSIHGNLFAANRWRNPQLAAPDRIEVVNNLAVGYGPEGLSVTKGPATIDVINNVYQAGPATPDPTTRAAIELGSDDARDRFFLSGNETPMGLDVARGPGLARLASERVAAGSGLRILPTEAVRGLTLATAGARAPRLDPIDARILAEAEAASGQAPANLATPGAPAWRSPMALGVEADTDLDGVPDAAERRIGSDPAAFDSHLPLEPDGYAVIEIYANDLLRDLSR